MIIKPDRRDPDCSEHNRPASRPRAAGKQRPGGTIAAVWLGLGVAALTPAAAILDVGSTRSTTALATLALLFGLWVFWRHGGERITAVGIYNFAFALFVGFAGVYQAAVLPVGTSAGPLLTAVAWCYFLQVVTWQLFWTKEPPPIVAESREVSPAVALWTTTLGFSVLLGAVLVSPGGAGLELLANAAGFVGTLLVGVGLLRGPGRRRWICGAIVTSGALAFYVHFLFHGFGRIVLGSLGFGLLIVLARHTPGRLSKAAVLLGAAPVLVVLAKVRVYTVEQIRPDIRGYENGLESVVSPLQSFTTLLNYHHAGLLPNDWGHTFLAALFALVPRAIWPDKPIGFGAELVAFLNPGLVGTSHSDAALFFGEWLYNYGLAGLVLMVPAVGLAVCGLDQLLVRAQNRPLDSMGAVLQYAAAVVTASGVIDLLWVGTFSYMSRSGSRLLILAGLLVLLAPKVRTQVVKASPLSISSSSGFSAGDRRPQPP
jgi:hypothetical protein